VPIASVYSGVVSLRGLHIIIFLAELNGLELWSADIGNAYLEARTQEKVYSTTGPEFKELEGHILVVFKHSTVYAVPGNDGVKDLPIVCEKWDLHRAR
jgi:hypothetical protein